MTDRNAEPELPRGIALAWGVAANPQRGPKREMSVERIVEAAIELADSDGLSAVSMAAVAAKLGYTPMSLYRYVTAKDDLILLMQEEATGLPPASIGDREGGWRGQLETLYHEQVQRYLEHPWVLEIPLSGAPATPNSSAWMDAGLRALAETALTPSERLAVILFVTGHARWAGTIIADYARVERDEGRGQADIAQKEDALFRELISADAYPHLREAIDAGVFLDESDPFAFGLARSLDGLAAYLAALADGQREAPHPSVDTQDAEIAGDRRFREARRTVRDAEKALRDARRAERQAAREARERLAR